MRKKVIGVGEVLWDVFPDGARMGGAPANFAFHAGSLAGEPGVITRVGADRLGRDALERLAGMGLPVGTVQVDEDHATGTVEVRLDPGGSPEYEFAGDVAWDFLVADGPALAAAGGADAICFGTLAQRSAKSRAAIVRLVEAVPEGAMRVFDVNLRGDFYSAPVIEQSLGLATAMKLNEEELGVLAEMFGLKGGRRERLAGLAGRYGLDWVALTLGKEGSVLLCGDDYLEETAKAVTIVDTVGAGDAFTAGLVMSLLSGLEMGEAHGVAAEAARHVCGQAGATPRLPESLRARVSGGVP